MKALAEATPETEFIFEYSPESFTGTELEVALDICEAVKEVIQPTPRATDDPQSAGDRRDGDAEHLRRRTSNGSGGKSRTATASSSRSIRTTIAAPRSRRRNSRLMAGADRVEGTLFGNGERTGNVDIVTMALNLFTQGVDPEARPARHQRDQGRGRTSATSCPCTSATLTSANWSTRPFPARIRTRSRRASRRRTGATTRCSRCRICRSIPKDVGRDYEAVIRINSQSGKGGMAYILQGRSRARSAARAAGRVLEDRAGA